MMVKLINGDCLEMLKQLEENSIDSVVCDPPYELGFMGKSWDKTGIAFNPAVWRECLRVLKPGGHLLAFGGSRTFHRIAVAIEDAGFEIRDTIMWLYGSGFPKSHDVSKGIDKRAGMDLSNDDDYIPNPAASQWQGWGTALKPAHEPIILARKPLQGTVAENVLQWGTGGINVDGCRVDTVETLGRAKGGWGNAAVGATNYGNFNSVGITKEGGRWPANIIHDGSEEVVAGFPETTVCGGAKNTTHNTGMFGIGKPGIIYNHSDGDNRSAARFFYCAKASKADRDEGLDSLPDKEWKNDGAAVPQRDDRPFNPSKNNHPTVKPTALMRYLCRLVTQPGGLVLDPFMGSGSTGKAAVLEGFSFIGIEREFEYLEISAARIAYVSTDKIESPIVVNQKTKPEIRQTGLF